MQPLIHKLETQFPGITFLAGAKFYWSPENKQVVYKGEVSSDSSVWALLHETSHGILGHNNYRNDFELVEMEVAAWERAKQLAEDLALHQIDEDHIQDCLDTYRDWLHKRCLCPTCGNRSFQQDASHYTCHNCSATWQVTPSRFCRAYRAVKQSSRPLWP